MEGLETIQWLNDLTILQFHRVPRAPLTFPKNAKATPEAWLPSNFDFCLASPSGRRSLFSPITKPQIFSNFAAFVAMLLGFLGGVSNFAEGFPRIADHFRDEV
jgi:hypothetical protein